jgi:hypothetical protein
MRLITYDGDFMISSFDLSPDDLCKLAGAVVSAMQMLHPTPWQPKFIIGEWDDNFGNSVYIEYKYQSFKK